MSEIEKKKKEIKASMNDAACTACCSMWRFLSVYGLIEKTISSSHRHPAPARLKDELVGMICKLDFFIDS